MLYVNIDVAKWIIAGITNEQAFLESIVLNQTSSNTKDWLKFEYVVKIIVNFINSNWLYY